MYRLLTCAGYLFTLCNSRNLQELDKIDTTDYMLSVCGNETLRELTSPGKSGCLLYLSHDDRFVIKTMRKSEIKVFHSQNVDSLEHHSTVVCLASIFSLK